MRFTKLTEAEQAEFMAAESKGTYLNQVFKPREHRYIGVKTGGRLAS